jgi:hypothetical protein
MVLNIGFPDNASYSRACDAKKTRMDAKSPLLQNQRCSLTFSTTGTNIFPDSQKPN